MENFCFMDKIINDFFDKPEKMISFVVIIIYNK